ncbi:MULTISPECIES: hypothetical protein [unclassified Pseudoxanthomonas]|uniref:hypothetical protein n=1 Tax=unclassified Pseudoxanthomonas TaxID=2645906 RepID=UPI00307F4371
MVDIVQSNETKLLIRKIGYSVGLESTLSRFKLLIDVYVDHGQLSDPLWQSLVKNGFNREIQSRKHFENVFGVLGIFSVDNGRPVPHALLDVGALLKRHYSSDPSAFDRALRAVLLYAITLADGELFGTLLATCFDKRQYERRLAEFRQEKLSLFYERYKNKFDREKLHQVIDFQEVPSGPEGKGAQRATLGPFAQARSAARNRDIDDFSVSLSDDWYKKVPARREAWAQDLGLFTNGAQTDSGQRYVHAMRSLVAPNRPPNAPIVLMPLDTEMRPRHVTWALDDTLIVDHDQFLKAIGNTYASKGSTQDYLQAIDIEQLASYALEQFMRADTRFQMLRRELPYIVFSLFVLGICVSEDLAIGSLKSDLEAIAKEKRNMLLRPSRVSVYGISFSRA